MLLNLKDSASKAEQHAKITVYERLPVFIKAPCVLNFRYKLSSLPDYYLLHLAVSASLSIVCQRCLQAFTYDYVNRTAIAICDSEQKAEKIMDDYECIVNRDKQVNLAELLVDELHLYAPQYHSSPENCDKEISHFIRQNPQDDL